MNDTINDLFLLHRKACVAWDHGTLREDYCSFPAFGSWMGASSGVFTSLKDRYWAQLE
jgi:hypothetical protein